MNSQRQNGLKKIYLFKSADYQFSEVDLSDNTLLLGESGVGKTTLMRAILFFYTMDSTSSMLNINRESKKSFNEWYFQERNSHIVYEYYKEEKPYLFVVSRSSNLHYTFIEMNNGDISVKDLFLRGSEPATLEVLNENIEKHRLPKYHTTYKEKYIRAFHKNDVDGKKIKWDKKEGMLDFTLFESMTARKEFAKTLSNIFATSKISADSVKKTIVSLIEETSNHLNLKNVREPLDDYVQFRTQIRRFERLRPRIDELKSVVDEYKENKERFKEEANQIHLIKNQSEIKLLEIKNEIVKLEEEKGQLDTVYKPKISQLSTDIDKKEKEIFSENKEINKMKSKRDEYKAQHIDTLVSEYENKKSYENSLEIYRKKYDALTSSVNELKMRYEEIFEQFKKDKENSIFQVKDENRVKKEEVSTQRIELVEKERSDIETETVTFVQEKEGLVSKVASERKVLVEIEIKQAKVENFPYNQKNIKQFSDEIIKFQEESRKLESVIVGIKHDIDSTDEKIENIPLKLKEEKEKLHEKISKIRHKLIVEKEEIEKKLDFDKNNLYSFINKNQIEHRDKLLIFLKDEVLFANRTLHVEKVDNSTSIFGLDIRFEDENFGFEYDTDSLQNQLELIKSQIKEHNELLHEKNKTLEEDAREATSTLNRKRTKLYKEMDEKKVLEEKYQAFIVKSKNNLDDAEKVAKKMRKEEKEKLDKEYLKQKENVDELDAKIKKLSENISDISSKIKKSTQTKIDELNVVLSKLDKDEKETIHRLEEAYTQNVKESEAELNNLLKQNGIDEKELKQINDNITKYRKRIEAIEENENIVRVYLSEYKKEIEKIPFREENLEKEKNLLVSIKENLKTIKDEFKIKHDAVKDKVEKVQEVEKNLNSFLEKYSEEIENQPIVREIKSLLSLEYTEDINVLLSNQEFLSKVIDNLTNTYSKLGNNRDSIINKTQLATKGLDRENIFKLDIVDDYMEESNNIERYLPVANGLIDYIEKDKINILKETSSSKYINHLNAITKDIKLFEESLLDIEGKVNKLDNRVKKAVESFKVIDAIKIKKDTANNEVLEKLKLVTDFYETHSESFLSGLFLSETEKEESRKVQDELASKIEALVLLLSSKKESLSLEEGFVLTFSVTENGNKLTPAETLNDIGSNGTSTLVKSIINISLLQMVNQKSEILNHCILDEIGTISPSYFKELKDYANSSGFLFVNGMPTEDDILISMYPTVYLGQSYGKYSRMLLASKMVV